MGQIKNTWKAILKSFKAHIVRNLFLLLIIAVWFIFSSYWVGVINDCILSPIGKCMQPTAASIIYWVLIAFLVGYYCIVLFGKERVVHPLRFRIAFGVAVAYFISIVFGYWSFTNWFWPIGYSDIFFLPFFFEFLFLCKVVYISEFKEKERYEGLKFDKPILDKEPDQVDISLHNLFIWVISSCFKFFNSKKRFRLVKDFFLKLVRFCTLLREKKNESTPTISHDQVEDKDTYGRNGYAKSVAARLIKTYDEDLAFATGITGEWGSGKSSFLNLIKHEVKSSDSKIEIIDFKPWFCKSPEFIIDDFFTQFERTISVYSPSISRLLNQYALSLSDIKGTDIGAWINFAAHCFVNQDIQTQYEKISKQLSEAKIKTMVFIDDTDRLDKSEIMEVLRLIRNTANFPYLQFIVAYDKEYVISTIHDLMPGKESQYLEKIFNTEITLPNINESIIGEKLIEQLGVILNRCFKDDISFQNELVQLIRFINIKVKSDNDIKYKFVNRLIVSSRDLIRFTNSLEIAITAIKLHFNNKTLEEFNLVDLFYLELIKYKYPQAYDELKNNMINVLCVDDNRLYIPIESVINTDEPIDYNNIDLDSSQSNEQSSKLDNLSSFKLEPFSTWQDYDLLVFLLNRLFPRDKTVKNKDISSLDFYEMYFMYRSVDEYHKYSKILSLINNPNELNFINIDNLETCLNASLNIVFKSLIDADDDNIFYEEVYKFIKELQKYNPSYRITPIIESSFEKYLDLYPFKTHAQGVKLVELIFDILNIFNEVTRKELFKLLLCKDHFYFNKVDSNSENQVNILKDIVTEDLILGHLKKAIWHFEIIQGLSFIINKSEIFDENLVVPKSDLRIFQVDLLINYLSLNAENIDLQKALAMLFYCRDEKTDVNFKAAKLIHSCILLNPDKYIEVFVKANNGKLDVDLFWKSLFENESSFEAFIMDHSLDESPDIDKARIMWNLYKNNGLQGLFLGETDPYYIDFVDNNGDKLKQDLEKLVGINEQLKIIINQRLTIGVKQEKFYELKVELNNIKLRIKLFNDIKTLIDEKASIILKNYRFS